MQNQPVEQPSNNKSGSSKEVGNSGNHQSGKLTIQILLFIIYAITWWFLYNKLEKEKLTKMLDAV